MPDTHLPPLPPDLLDALGRQLGPRGLLTGPEDLAPSAWRRVGGSSVALQHLDRRGAVPGDGERQVVVRSMRLSRIPAL